MEKLNIPRICGATLLTAGEADVLLKKEERATGRKWWLRTIGNEFNKITYVDEEGNVNYDGIDCLSECDLIPVLQIGATESFKVGDKFSIGSMTFKIIAPRLAILNKSIKTLSFISKETFDSVINNFYCLDPLEDEGLDNVGFELSEAKRYLSKWFDEIMRALREHGMI